MEKPSRSIFARILTASLVPFIIVLGALLITVSQIIYKYNERQVRDTVSFFASHASEKITDTLFHISSLVKLSANSIDEMVGTSEEHHHNMRSLLYALMEANPEIYCAWYVFEEGLASSEPGWFIETFLKRDGKIVRGPSETQEQLDDPKYSPWHVGPYNTGEVFQDAVEYWDYGVGNGVEFTGTIAYPVWKNGRIVGTLGIDILYESAFRFLDDLQQPDEQKLMLFASNGIVLYSENDRYWRKTYEEVGFEKDIVEDMKNILTTHTSILKESRSPLFGEQSLISITPVSVPNAVHKIYLYLDRPTNKLFAEIRNIIFAILVLGLAGLAALAAAAFYTSRSIAKPIGRLTRFAKRVANGQFEPEAAAEEDFAVGRLAEDEIAVLRDSVSKMVTQLNQTHQLRLAAVQAEVEKEQAEEASRERTQFFANMSHEIRTPMNAIMGISELMLAEPLPDRQRERALDIRSSARSLLVIINDILDISRMESGRFTLVESDFDFHALLNNLSSVCQYLADEKGLRFVMELNGELPRCLHGDEGRLKQVLLNLLGNAVKFTDDGQVSFVVEQAGEDKLRFFVADTGVGIRDEDKPFLFNAFKQVDQVKNRHVKGTGLGLSIAKSLVEMMGGTIELDSEYGKGSVFRVELPLVVGDEANMVQEEDGTGRWELVQSDARVLIVDDNLVNLKVANGLLGMHGLQCDLAKSGKQAIAMAGKREYDLIFMDHMMPEMDGVEATLAIRGLGGHNAAVPIIALTANAITGVREILLESGMNDYVSKPIQRMKLNAVLSRWLPRDKVRQGAPG